MTYENNAVQLLKKKYAGSLNYFLETTFLPTTADIISHYTQKDSKITFKRLNYLLLNARLQGLESQLKIQTDVDAISFVRQKILETKFLLSIIDSKNNAKNYQISNTEMYGSLDNDLGQKLFDYAVIKANKSSKLLTHSQKLYQNKYLIIPNSKNFLNNLNTLKLSINILVINADRIIQNVDLKQECQDIAKFIFELKKEVWSVEFRTSRKVSMVDKVHHRLILGNSYINGNIKSKKRILLHELVHVLRSNFLNNNIVDSAFEEGLAHLVERLGTNKSVIPARYWRYLAIWLIEQQSSGRYFSYDEISQLLIELYMPIKKCNLEEAEKFVWGLIFRVTKGLDPTTKGLAHHKDLRYAYGSLLVWDYLDKNTTTQQDIQNLLKISTI